MRHLFRVYLLLQLQRYPDRADSCCCLAASWLYSYGCICLYSPYCRTDVTNVTKKILDVFSLYGQPIRIVNGGSGVMSGLRLAATSRQMPDTICIPGDTYD